MPSQDWGHEQYPRVETVFLLSVVQTPQTFRIDPTESWVKFVRVLQLLEGDLRVGQGISLFDALRTVNIAVMIPFENDFCLFRKSQHFRKPNIFTKRCFTMKY